MPDADPTSFPPIVPGTSFMLGASPSGSPAAIPGPARARELTPVAPVGPHPHPSLLVLPSPGLALPSVPAPAWRLLGRKVLLVGGGAVATGRLYYLLEAGAKVTLIAPADGLTAEVRHRIDEGLVDRWIDREWEDADGEDLRRAPPFLACALLEVAGRPLQAKG